MHTDYPSAAAPAMEAIVASAQARGVPVISYKQLLDWIDGRNASTIRGAQLECRHVHLHDHRRRRRERPPDDAADPGPDRDAERASRCDGPPSPYTVQTIKGIQLRDVRRRQRRRSPATYS